MTVPDTSSFLPSFPSFFQSAHCPFTIDIAVTFIYTYGHAFLLILFFFLFILLAESSRSPFIPGQLFCVWSSLQH